MLTGIPHNTPGVAQAAAELNPLEIDFQEGMQALSRVLRGYGKAQGSTSQEFQSMRVGRQILVTGNTREDTDAVFEGLTSLPGVSAKRRLVNRSLVAIDNSRGNESYKPQSGDELVVDNLIGRLPGRSKLTNRFTSRKVGAAGVTNLIGSDSEAPSLILVNGNALHAEQQLLLSLCHMLRGDAEVDSVVQLGGSKVPCTRCGPVVAIFERALRTHYGIKLLYVTGGKPKNCGNDVAQLGPGDIPNGESVRYQAFSRELQTELAKL